MASETVIAVSVCYSPAPRQVWQADLKLAPGSTLVQALQASGLAGEHPALDLAHASVGVWGRKVPRDHVLREGDRVEVYRALRVDPKVARRERFARQGARTAGLFARRRSGGKAGY